MDNIILTAFERKHDKKKFNENGFIAGVIYGDSIKQAVSVKFEETPLKKLLAKHGSNAKLWVNYQDDKKLGFIKEIQRHPVTAKITHIDVQLVSKNHEIKLQLPIYYKGEEALSAKSLQLQVHKSEIDVFGRMDLMPDAISIDISEKELDDTITIKDFNLDKQIKVSDDDNEVYAIISHLRIQAVDDTSEEVPAEPETTEK